MFQLKFENHLLPFSFYIVLALSIFSCESSDSNFTTSDFELDKGYVLISESNNQKSIPYDYVGEIQFSLIAVGQKNRYGAIDRKGNVIIPIKYEFVKVFEKFALAFSSTSVVINLNKYMVDIYDNKGDIISTEDFKDFDQVIPGIFWVDKDLGSGYLYDANGKPLTKTAKYYHNAFTKVKPQMIQFKDEANNIKYIKSSGEIISRPKYLPIKASIEKDFSKSSFLLVTDENEEKFIINELEEVVKIEQLSGYEINSISYNYAQVRKDKLFMVFDLVNNKFIDDVYTQMGGNVSCCGDCKDQGMIYFSGYNSEGKFFIKYESGPPILSDKTFIMDVCNQEKKDVKGMVTYDNSFSFYQGTGDDFYFQQGKSGKFFLRMD